MTYQLYTDGGARGNPGPAGIGAVIYMDGVKYFELSKYIGKTTNNEAEYYALLAGLMAAQNKEIKNLECFLDSELVVKQLNGEYKVKNATMKKYYDKVLQLKSEFESISFTHVKRADNKEADRLVNEALDANDE